MAIVCVIGGGPSGWDPGSDLGCCGWLGAGQAVGWGLGGLIADAGWLL